MSKRPWELYSELDENGNFVKLQEFENQLRKEAIREEMLEVMSEEESFASSYERSYWADVGLEFRNEDFMNS